MFTKAIAFRPAKFLFLIILNTQYTKATKIIRSEGIVNSSSKNE